MNYILSIVFCMIVVFQNHPALAQPKPESKKEALGNLDQKLKDYKADKDVLERDAIAAEKQYEITKKKLIKTSATVQKNQAELFKLEERLSDLHDDQKQIKAELKEEREALGETITALLRIEKTPPQAMMARPAAPIDTARGAMLLQKILPVLNAKAEALKEKSETFAANEKELKEKKKKLVLLSERLSGEEKELKSLVDDRKKQYAALNTNLEQRKKDIEAVSKQAKNLSDLVKRLETERTRNAQRLANESAQEQQRTASKPIKQAALPTLGKSQLPLSGSVRTRFNQKDDFGAKSQGVSIEGRGGALIVSPMGGIVRFAGYFKNYGNMVIIEHKNGYHSLIAGLEKIDTVVDQSVSAGEPLGKLYNSKNGKPPTLYYELRLNGKSIDPARKFTELG